MPLGILSASTDEIVEANDVQGHPWNFGQKTNGIQIGHPKIGILV
jgi:hypothetical protein